MSLLAAGGDAASGGGSRDRTISVSSHESIPLLGHQAEALIACNQKLQQLGINQMIRLPQLTLIGDQSTGKSSLVEHLSTIKVPKAKGCCTQCPIAINLTSGSNSSSPWICTISIEQHYDWVEALRGKGVTKNNPFGPWQKREQVKVVRIKTTNDKDEVSDLITAAQSVVLNPGSHYQDYLGSHPRKLPINQTAKFSPNVIRLDVSEGNWPNLSFIDLPGVIANTSKDQDKYLVKLIRNLVHKYAAAERSINMLTLPMTHDIENSQACAIVQELKAEAHTLAVFTKADLADDDQRAQFLRRFTGEDDLAFEHGYHFVVMPDNMEQKEARAFEVEVFAQEPWSLLNQEYQSRLGIDALRVRLRRLLFEKTAETLPDSLNSIQSRLLQVDAELTALPTPPNASLLPLQLQQNITNFKTAMKTLFLGDSTSQGVSARNAWTQNVTKFRDTVTGAKPTIILTSRNEQSRLNKANAKIKKSQPRITDNTNLIELSSGDEANHSPPVKAEPAADSKVDPVHRFRFEDIREINDRHYQACVPGEIELKAVEEMNKLSVQHWNTLLNEFMDANSKLLNKQVSKVLYDVFQHCQHLELFSVIQNHVKEYLDKLIQNEWTIAEEVCRLECERPLTYDLAGLKEKEAKCLEVRLQKRLERRQLLFKLELEAAGVVSKQKRRKGEEDDLEPDPFQTELRMSAKTRAYYEVASTRFVDNICLGLFGRLLPTCTENLVDDLTEHLGLNDHTKHEQIISWMAEDAEREAKRKRLISERNQLVEGLRYIETALGTDTASPSKRRKVDSPDGSGQEDSPSKRSKTALLNGSPPPTSSTSGRLAFRNSMEMDD